MKPKPKMVTGGTTTEEDDPVGLIPSAFNNAGKFKDASIKGG